MEEGRERKADRSARTPENPAANSLAFRLGAMELAERRAAETALVRREDAPRGLVQRVKYDGRMVPFGEYVELQKALALELANRSGGNVSTDYWRRFEIVKLPDGKYRALARKEALEEFEDDDGNLSAKAVANFTYSGAVGLNARRPNARYGDEARLLAMHGEDGNAPKVGEVQAWAVM